MIPKLIHQIWIQGYNNIPSQLKMYQSGCENINDDFKFVIWDDDKIKDFLKKYFEKEYLELYNKYNIYAQKADFARYAILYIYGGIYLDMDMLCRKNLSPFLKHNFFCAKNNYPFFWKRYLNGIVGTIPKHPVFLFVFKNIFLRQNRANDVTYSTGTGLFFDSVNEYMKTTDEPNITFIDTKYLHPCHTFDSEFCPYTCDSCYVAHIHYGSWYSDSEKYFKKNIKMIVFITIIITLLIFYYMKNNVS